MLATARNFKFLNNKDDGVLIQNLHLVLEGWGISDRQFPLLYSEFKTTQSEDKFPHQIADESYRLIQADWQLIPEPDSHNPLAHHNRDVC